MVRRGATRHAQALRHQRRRSAKGLAVSTSSGDCGGHSGDAFCLSPLAALQETLTARAGIENKQIIHQAHGDDAFLKTQSFRSSLCHRVPSSFSVFAALSWPCTCSVFWLLNSLFARVCGFCTVHVPSWRVFLWVVVA